MAKEDCVKWLGPISFLCAVGVTVASAVLLSVVVDKYSNINSNHYVTIDRAYEISEKPTNVDSKQLSHSPNAQSTVLTGVKYTTTTPRDRNVIRKDNEIIKSKYPKLHQYIEQSKGGPLSFEGLMRSLETQKGSLESAKSKRAVTPKSEVDNDLAIESNENGPKCPSSNEYKAFILLSSAGIGLGGIQILMAVVACLTTKKDAHELPPTLIVYDLCSCLCLAIVFFFSLSKGHCIRIRNAVEGSATEWLAFVISVGIDCILLFFLLTYVTYILSSETGRNKNETELNTDNDSDDSDEKSDFEGRNK